MLRILCSGCVVGLALIAIQRSAQAQGGMNTGGSNFGGSAFNSGRSGGFGTSGFGSGGLGSVGFGSGGSGTGGMGGGGFGGSSFGSSGFGGSGLGGFGSGGFGTGGFGGGSTFGNQGIGGGMYGGGQGGQNFVGRDSGDMTAVMQQMNRSGQQFMNQFGRMMNRGGNRNREQETGENERPPVRVVLDVAFTHRQLPLAAVAAKLQTRMLKILATRNIAQPEVTVEGDTVVLRGVAGDESQRMVIERLAAMEPGVLKVDNQMTVALAPSESNPAATDSLR